MFILKYKKIFFAIGIVLVGLSLGAIFSKGFTVGIDFTEGSVLEVSYVNRPSVELIKAKIVPIVSTVEVQNFGDTGIVIRTEPIDQPTKETLLAAISFDEYQATEERFNTIGPSVGRELKNKAIISIIVISLVITLFIAFVFRKVAKPVSSWAYGVIAIVVLIHDVIIPAGVFAWFGIQVDTLFIVGLLTVLGVSINDTIVVFDRIRENLSHTSGHVSPYDFTVIVGTSIKQTLLRSLMTSIAVLFALAALWIWGPESTRNLSIVMFLGMFFGTYSSIFIASPLLVVWNNWRSKKITTL